MNRNIKIAKQLIKLAKQLIAFTTNFSGKNSYSPGGIHISNFNQNDGINKLKNIGVVLTKTKNHCAASISFNPKVTDTLTISIHNGVCSDAIKSSITYVSKYLNVYIGYKYLGKEMPSNKNFGNLQEEIFVKDNVIEFDTLKSQNSNNEYMNQPWYKDYLKGLSEQQRKELEKNSQTVKIDRKKVSEFVHDCFFNNIKINLDSLNINDFIVKG